MHADSANQQTMVIRFIEQYECRFSNRRVYNCANRRTWHVYGRKIGERGKQRVNEHIVLNLVQIGASCTVGVKKLLE